VIRFLGKINCHETRFWLFQRGKTFYIQDSATGEQKSLGRHDRREAKRLLELRTQSDESPTFRQLLLKTCLAPEDLKLATRLWETVMAQMLNQGKESMRERCERAFNKRWFDLLRKIKLIETTAEHFLLILNVCPSSVNHYLLRLHNLGAIEMA
jgi:hypothetical protein